MIRRGPVPITDPRAEIELRDLTNAIRQVHHETYRAEEGLITPEEALTRISAVTIEVLGGRRV